MAEVLTQQQLDELLVKYKLNKPGTYTKKAVAKNVSNADIVNALALPTEQQQESFGQLASGAGALKDIQVWNDPDTKAQIIAEPQKDGKYIVTWDQAPGAGKADVSTHTVKAPDGSSVTTQTRPGEAPVETDRVTVVAGKKAPLNGKWYDIVDTPQGKYWGEWDGESGYLPIAGQPADDGTTFGAPAWDPEKKRWYQPKFNSEKQFVGLEQLPQNSLPAPKATGTWKDVGSTTHDDQTTGVAKEIVQQENEHGDTRTIVNSKTTVKAPAQRRTVQLGDGSTALVDESDPNNPRPVPIPGTEKPKDTSPFPSFDESDVRLGQLGQGLVRKLKSVYEDTNLTAEQKTSRAEQLIGAARVIEAELRNTVTTQAGIHRDDTDIYKTQLQETQSRRALGANSATYAMDFLKSFGPTANDGALLGKAFIGMAMLPMKLAQMTGGMATPQAPVKGPALQQAGAMGLPNEPSPQAQPATAAPTSPVNITFNGVSGGGQPAQPGFGWAGGGAQAGPPGAVIPEEARLRYTAPEEEEPAPQGFLGGGWA
jgi:hypothetical protein